MAVDKFSISLPEDLASDIEQIAHADGLSRSAVIREAAATYVASRKSAARDRARRERIDSALAGFEEVASSWGEDPLNSRAHLRRLRAEDSVDDVTGPAVEWLDRDTGAANE